MKKYINWQNSFLFIFFFIFILKNAVYRIILTRSFNFKFIVNTHQPPRFSEEKINNYLI